jgi:hypothetical protein
MGKAVLPAALVPPCAWQHPMQHSMQHSMQHPMQHTRQLLGSFWAASRQILGSFWAASGQLLGSFWAASGQILDTRMPGYCLQNWPFQGRSSNCRPLLLLLLLLQVTASTTATGRRSSHITSRPQVCLKFAANFPQISLNRPSIGRPLISDPCCCCCCCCCRLLPPPRSWARRSSQLSSSAPSAHSLTRCANQNLSSCGVTYITVCFGCHPGATSMPTRPSMPKEMMRMRPLILWFTGADEAFTRCEQAACVCVCVCS